MLTISYLKSLLYNYLNLEGSNIKVEKEDNRLKLLEEGLLQNVLVRSNIPIISNKKYKESKYAYHNA
jgi:hypothetical protein